MIQSFSCLYKKIVFSVSCIMGFWDLWRLAMSRDKTHQGKPVLWEDLFKCIVHVLTDMLIVRQEMEEIFPLIRLAGTFAFLFNGVLILPVGLHHPIFFSPVSFEHNLVFWKLKHLALLKSFGRTYSLCLHNSLQHTRIQNKMVTCSLSSYGAVFRFSQIKLQVIF